MVGSATIRKCARCGKTFNVTEDNSCFITCVTCRRRVDKIASRANKFPNEPNRCDEWYDSNLWWDDIVRSFEG